MPYKQGPSWRIVPVINPYFVSQLTVKLEEIQAVDMLSRRSLFAVVYTL